MKSRIGIVVLAVALVASVFVSSEAQASEPADSRSVVEAVAFGTGPMSADISEVLGRPMLEGEAYLAKRAQAVQVLDAIEPAQVDRVASELMSGDPYRVSDALDDLAVLVDDALVEVFGADYLKAAMDASEAGSYGGCSWLVGCWVAIAGGIFLVVLSAIYAGVTFWSGHNPLTTPDEANVARDAIVADLTGLLAR